jgi:predicted nucleotidyltransferase component of viral defense system
MEKAYIETVRLLLEALPTVFQTPAFAMKGGTALNLFVEDMPRLSVGIDVVFTDHRVSRENALQSISAALETARNRLVEEGLGRATE